MPSRKQMDAADFWLVLLNQKQLAECWKSLAYGAEMQARWQRAHSPQAEPMSLELPNACGSRVILATQKTTATAFEQLTLARKMAQLFGAFRPQQVNIILAGFAAEYAEAGAESLVATLLACSAEYPDLRSKKKPRWLLKALHIYGSAPSHKFARTFAEINGNSHARHLAALPPTHLTPASYRKRIMALAKSAGLKVEFYDEAALKKKGAGAFLAVSQGSPARDAGIVRLRYTPAKPGKLAAIALVGKGICFDTGGVNLKAPRYMLGMQADMQGSAIALGALLALAQLKVPYPVEAWLALAMNHIGERAYKPTDVVTAANGTTIEIIHTDAEGRMVLSDTLALCSQTQPRLIIDYATLTGSCVQAIGKAYSGAFTNREEFWLTLIAAGRESGERVWPFPLDGDFEDLLESKIADIKQCNEDGQVDHILAARFLQKFVDKKIPWVHVDLSSASHKGGLAHIPTDFNGFGVRLTLALLLDHEIQEIKTEDTR